MCNKFLFSESLDLPSTDALGLQKKFWQMLKEIIKDDSGISELDLMCISTPPWPKMEHLRQWPQYISIFKIFGYPLPLPLTPWVSKKGFDKKKTANSNIKN